MATRTLLAVEPDDAALEVVRRALGPYGFEVKTLSSGEQAVDWARENGPAVVLISVEPRKVGYAICNKFKRSADLEKIPVILVSAEETPQTFEQHKKLKLRANEYILKPLDREELLSKVDQLVGLGAPEVTLGSVTSEEIVIAPDMSDEISIAEADIVEEKSPTPIGAARNGGGESAKSLFGGGDLDAIFDQETDAAFAALQGGSEDVITSLPQPTGVSTFSADGWNDEATRATSMPPLDFAFPVSAPPPELQPELEAEKTLPPEPVLVSAPPPPLPEPTAVMNMNASLIETRDAPAFEDVSSPVIAGFDTAEVPPSPDEVSPPVMLEATPMAAVDETARARVAELEAKLRDAETERERLQSDIESLRERLQAAPLSKDRELLALREVINKKEKDVLDLRDALDAKERQMLDHKDRIREHERARRDLDEKMLGIEKNLMAANERASALAHDKEKSLERERNLKARLDDALTEIQKAHEEVDGLKKRVAATEEKGRADLDRLRGELEGRIAEQDESHRKELAKLAEERAAADLARDQEHQAEVARLTTQHATEVEALQRRAAEEQATLSERLQGEIARMRRDHEKAIASLKEEQALQVAAERQAHQAAIDGKERDHKNEILGLRRRQEEELAGAEERRQRELAEAEARRVTDLDAAENRRRAELQARDEEHHAVVAEMDRRHFTEKTELGERHRGELDQANGRASRAEGELAARTEELSEAHRRLAGLAADLDAARAELRDRDVKLGQSRDRISELEARAAEFEDQILRAYQKLRNDDKMIEKAKRALAVALTVLEDRNSGSSGNLPAAKPGPEESAT